MLLWKQPEIDVGFDAGDSSRYFENEWSWTSTLSNLVTSSNVGLPGRWLYRIDGVSVQIPNIPEVTGVLPSIGRSQHNQLMYPFGPSAGDASPIWTNCDYGYTPTPTRVSPLFPYFNNAYATIYVHVDGFLAFNYASVTGCPDESTSYPTWHSFIAAYHNNHLPSACYTGGAGSIWYRYTTDVTTLSRLAYDIQQYFNYNELQYFNPVWAFIATWDSVAQWKNVPSLTNTMQIVLTTDGQRTFVLLNYRKIQWNKSSSCRTPARVVLGAGDYKNYYVHPFSETPYVTNLTNTTNCGLNGRWAYRVDGTNVLLPTSPSINAPLPSPEQTSALIMSSLLFPHGLELGDQIGPTVLDSNGCIGPIVPAVAFPFFGENRYTIYGCFNGHLMLDMYDGHYNPYSPPSYRKQISVYSQDLFSVNQPASGNTSVGNLFVRLSTNATELAIAARLIQQYYTYPGLDQFTPIWVFVATWSNVTYWVENSAVGPSQPTSTFQVVLVTDGEKSFAMLNYETLTWTSATSTGGNAQGLNGTTALVGFDGGNNWNYYLHPWALTPDVINMTEWSNCGLKGRWVYRIDQPNALFPNQPSISKAFSIEATVSSATVAPTPANSEDSDLQINTTVPFIVGLTNDDPAISPPLLFDYVICNVSWNATNQLYPAGLAPDGSIVTVQCPVNQSMYRYVVIQLPTNDTLTICEVDVFSSSFAWMQHSKSKINYGVYQNFTTDGKTTCLRTCMNDVNCDSVNFNPSQSTCQLIKQYEPAVVNSTDVVADDSWDWWCNQYTSWN